MAKRLGPCDNCGAKIRRDVKRCPECGYEPSAEGILANRIVGTGAVGVFLLSAMFVLISLALPFSGVSILLAVAGFVVFGLVTVGSGWLLYLIYRRAMLKPVDS